jgi:hypothetical protein
VPPILHSTACPQCGEGGGGGECAPGEECLPSDFVAPCPDGQECLPSDFIDPDDCPSCPSCALLESPDDIEGLIQWYDADDGATLTLTGDVVDAWADKSSGNNDLTAVLQQGGYPRLDTAALNGRDVVSGGGTFGVDEVSLRAAFTMEQPFHVFAVALWHETGNASTIAGGDAGGGSWQIFRGGSDDLTAISAGGGHATGSGSNAAEVPHIVTVAFNGASSTMRLDMTELFAGDLGSGGQDGNLFSLLDATTGNRGINGYVAEYLTYDRILTDEETACVEDYLLRKWFSEQTPCEECACDPDAYQPYCIGPENADDPETVLLTLSPFALHMLDEASGATVAVDSSGNGNDGGLAGTRAQLGAGLSDKTATGFHLDANSGVVGLVSPTGTGLGTDGEEFAIAALVRINDIAAASNNFPVWLSHCSSGNNYDLLLIDDGDDSGAHTLLTRGEPTCGVRPDWITLDVPFVFVLNGPADAVYALGARSTWEVWVDGVLVTSGMRRNTGDFAGGVRFGQPNDSFFGSPDMDIGPIVTFDRALTYAEIKTITEVLLDGAIAAGGNVPS